MECANSDGVPSIISFDIPMSDPGLINPDLVPNSGDEGAWVISTLSALPTLTDSATTIDGSSQVGASCGTGYDSNGLSIGRSITVQIDGSNADPAVGINVDAADTVISGLSIGNFSGMGIQVKAAGSNATIECNNIGINAAGDTVMANGQSGIISYSANTSIGNGSYDGMNILSGNTHDGFRSFTGSTGAIVSGNIVGLDATAQLPMPNQRYGISAHEANNLTIGGTSGTTAGGTCTGACNRVAGNTTVGVHINAITATNVAQGVRVLGNHIGATTAGEDPAVIGNKTNGVQIQGSSFVLIGDGTAAGRNIISGNVLEGIDTNPDTSNIVIAGNFIGVDRTGNAALHNQRYGFILDGNDITLGGSDAGDRNIITSKSWMGGTYISDNLVVDNNYFGLGADGSTLLPNTTGSALWIWGNSASDNSNNTIVRNNVIASSANYGINTQQTSGVVSGLQVYGNTIGLIADRSSKGAVADAGIYLNGATNAQIGGTSGTTPGGACTGECNRIAGNGTDGIRIANVTASTQAEGVRVYGNHIGQTSSAEDASFGNGSNGIQVTESKFIDLGNSTDAGRNVISGNIDHGIQLVSGGNNADVNIMGNVVGLDSAGSAAMGNGKYGIYAYSTARLKIGDGTAGGRNVSSDNGNDGIIIAGSTAAIIEGNYLGTDITGETGIGNKQIGASIWNTSDVQVINNVISGNLSRGLYIPGVNNMTVQGNMIGTDKDGLSVIANNSYGIMLYDDNSTYQSSDVLIGGTGAGEGNVISGNIQSGIYFAAHGTNGGHFEDVQIIGNMIGVDINGSNDLGNAATGISSATGTTNVHIGDGTVAGQNIISNNAHQGIALVDAIDTDINNNLIGVDIAGADAGNGTDGILIHGASSGVKILDSVIAYSANRGVEIGVGSGGVRLNRNIIHSNGELGIDLVGTGIDKDGVVE